MNREKTLTLYAQGREAWNAWAERMLAERKRLENAGEWQWSRGSGDNDATWAWERDALADFSSRETPHTFEDDVDLSSFVFPGIAWFDSATFSGDARFNGATFSGNAGFTSATFGGIAGFDSATFSGDARFNGATFSGDAGFTSATFGGYAWFDSATFGGYARFNGATFSGNAVFTSATFGGIAGFDSATFGGIAGFDSATFSGNAVFTSATFGGIARFNGATFSGDAGFTSATFGGYAWFDSATFGGIAGFNSATFGGYAGFTRARFKGYTVFDRARFEDDARFTAMQGESYFSLRNVTFEQVPDFEQAHFAEAPRLDISHFRPGHVQARRFWRASKADVKEKSNALDAAEITSRWRSLKRLASQGHDHEREQLFFARELQSLRGSTDWALPRPANLLRRGQPVWQNGARYWAGIAYETFSDFGRSIFRPLLWWCGSTVVFALVYLGEHIARAGHKAYGSFWEWTFNGFHMWLKGIGAWPFVINYPALERATAGPPLACLVGGADGTTPLSAALAVSVRKGLLFAGLGDTDKASQDYACLYGLDRALMAEVNNQQLVRLVPDAVAYMGVAQTVLSAVLLFLFLLALRNQFRIR